ncbi:putative phage-type endonuclease [Comamonas sp. BIGb0152]|uniref:YqaJ viral recombinase family protein n=1 Tax=Comamonas sp. BIGb0152 TaxID=2940601 RepID=UPI00216A0EB4|nr:YqaJ viral recombinase family protein [Comamonas sp. BIGb0152]MCS4292692.1 putative phage-type endonuclease [Comamonas sp. BIGb0152]
MKVVNLTQGTPAWHAHRAAHFNASDAPAMMGCSSYTSRSELIKRLSTGIEPEVDAATQRRFDQGHQFEELARPLAEKIVGEELAPLVGTNGKNSASFDGLTLMGETAWEHKSLNERLRNAMTPSATGTDLPLEYQVQMEHQAMVAETVERTLFLASKWVLDQSTGEWICEEQRSCWYTPNPELRAKIVAGWAQLEQEVTAYQPEAEAAKPAPEAKLRDALPALRLDAKGEITTSNLDEFKAGALTRINSINTVLETDQQFAEADDDAKWLRDVAEAMKQAGKRVRANMQSVDEALTVLEQLDEIATSKAIALEKRVKSEKDARKQSLVLQAQQDLDSHTAALNQRLGTNWLPRLAGGFAEVIKGLKSLDSMRDRVAVALTNAKVDANALADQLDANRKHLVQDSGDWITLFPDFGTVGAKASEDFRALAALRIGQHQAAEAKKLEAQRERIRAEEQAKAQADVAEERKRIQEQSLSAQADIGQAVQAGTLAAPVADDLAHLAASNAAEAVAGIDAKQVISAVQARAASRVDDGRRITLGQIKALIAPLTIDSAGMAQLGFPHVAAEKASKLYRACDLPAIRDAMVKHLAALSFELPVAV